MTLAIDQLMRLNEGAPDEPLLPGRKGVEWRGLTNAHAWALSGAIASWLIAQGYGPGGKTLAVPDHDSPQRVALLLGALRAGAVVSNRGDTVDYGRLVAASIDAAVAERRLHIDEATVARQHDASCTRHGDFKSLEEAVTGRF
jgi:hypothetical protein